MKVLVLLLSLSFWNISFALVNVARGATATYCTNHPVPEELFDGVNAKEFQITLLEENCRKNTFLEIKTDQKYYVHYFVIYRGNGPDYGQMKFLRVEMLIHISYDACGEHYLPSFDYDVGIRINCPPKHRIELFKIQSHVNKGLFLSEVEMYYLGTNGTAEFAPHRGCFKSFTGDSQGVLTINICAWVCKNKYWYIAMKKGTECYCGSSFENEDSDVNCNIKCIESDKMCGGENSYSVYIINFRLPYYAGCFRRTDLKVPGIEGNDMTPGKCIQHCESEKMAWLSEGNLCRCDSNNGDMQLKREDCTAPCKGDKKLRCGSQHDNNIYSVWRGCINRESHASKCSDGFMCVGLIDEFGVCQGSCKSGFTGQHCLEKATQATTNQAPTTQTTNEAPTTQTTTHEAPTNQTATNQTTTNEAPTKQTATNQTTTNEAPTKQTATSQTTTTEAPTIQVPETQASATLATTKRVATKPKARKKKKSTKKKKAASESSRLDVINTSLCILNQFIIMLIRMNL